MEICFLDSDFIEKYYWKLFKYAKCLFVIGITESDDVLLYCVSQSIARPQFVQRPQEPRMALWNLVARKFSRIDRCEGMDI